MPKNSASRPFAPIISVAVLLAAIFLIPAAGSAKSVVEQDRERIRKHLRSVEAHLRAKDVSHLSAQQRQARKRNLDRLHRYWKQGEFPVNTHSSEQTPIFIDRSGRECAVGYLMVKSGWEREAKAIAHRENLKRLPNMESPEVAEWLDQSGLTAEEATRIQPHYNSPCSNCGCNYEPVCADNGNTYLNECIATKCAGANNANQGCCSAGDEPITAADLESPWGPRCQTWDSDAGQTRADTGADAGPSPTNACQGEPGAITPPADQNQPACSASPQPTRIPWALTVLLSATGLCTTFRRRLRR